MANDIVLIINVHLNYMHGGSSCVDVVRLK